MSFGVDAHWIFEDYVDDLSLWYEVERECHTPGAIQPVHRQEYSPKQGASGVPSAYPRSQTSANFLLLDVILQNLGSIIQFPFALIYLQMLASVSVKQEL